MNWKDFLRKYWVHITLLLIILLGIYIRTLDYNWPYLRNIDSYTFYRQMNDIIKNGGAMPNYDHLMLAPDGIQRSWELYPYQYIGAWSYMLFHIVIPGMQLWQYLIYLPAILASLAAVPMYYIGRTLYDKKAGLLAAFFIVFDISNISRSLGGDPDSDAIVILMPLIVMALFLITYKYIESKKAFDKKAILYSVITGIMLIVWTATWIGYWYIIWLITGMLIMKILLDFARTRKAKETWQSNKHQIFGYLTIMLIFSTVMMIQFGFGKIMYSFTGPFEFQSIKSEDNREFPNVYVSVAELQASGDIKGIIQRTSAINFAQSPLHMLISPFFLMVYGLIYLLYSYYKKEQHADTVILLLIWFIGPLLATITAVRFSMLFSAPMAIGSAIFLSKILRMILGEDNKFED